jgi:SagB-type dehydrogenase family enzyme
MGELFAYSWVQDASVALILTGVFSRTRVKYGQRGYRYTMLEAGHIGQNVYLVSEALGLKCRGMGGSYDIALEQLLGIDGENESVLYTLILGK